MKPTLLALTAALGAAIGAAAVWVYTTRRSTQLAAVQKPRRLP
jgi:hypothetical protein